MGEPVSQLALKRYWVRRDHLWEKNKGPLTRIDQTEDVYTAADIEQVLKDARWAAELLESQYRYTGSYKETTPAKHIYERARRLLASLTEGV